MLYVVLLAVRNCYNFHPNFRSRTTKEDCNGATWWCLFWDECAIRVDKVKAL
jgi:hypothetical protein